MNQLEIFVTVAERKSFTQAAGELYLAQSTVSAHIRRLEAVLGVRLFSRDTRKSVCLTPEGQRLYPAAKRVLANCREFRLLADNHRAGLPLTLGASTVPGQYLLPELLSAFLRRHPDCRYSLRRGDSAQIRELLRSGEIHIGFMGTCPEAEELCCVPVAMDRLVMVTENAPRFREMKRRGVWGRELLGEPTVAREEGSGTDRTVAAYLHQIGFPASRLQIVARIDNPETIKSMVARGAGVSVLSALAASEETQSGKLLAFEMDEVGLRRKIYMAYPKEGIDSELEQQFIRFVRTSAAKSGISD